MKTAILNPAMVAAAMVLGGVFHNGRAVAQCPLVTNITTETLTFDDLSPGEFSIPITTAMAACNGTTLALSPEQLVMAIRQERFATQCRFQRIRQPGVHQLTGTFTLKSAYLTSAYANQQVRALATLERLWPMIILMPSPQPPRFNQLQLRGVSRVMFTASADSEFVMDNLVISNLVLLDSDGGWRARLQDECPDTAPARSWMSAVAALSNSPCYGRRPAGVEQPRRIRVGHQQNR